MNGLSFGARITGLAIDPANPSTLYAGTNGVAAPVFKTTDGGANWAAGSNGLTLSGGPGQNVLLTVNALSVSPAAPATLYAATTAGGIFKSTNGGANWAAANTGLQNSAALSVLAHPSNASNVLAGFNIGGDGFVGKLNASGSLPVYFRYLGGSENEDARGVAVDAAGNAYVTGTTGSADFPVANALQPVKGFAFADAFVTKLSPDGQTLLYSTFLGGSTSETRARRRRQRAGPGARHRADLLERLPARHPARLDAGHQRRSLRLEAERRRLPAQLLDLLRRRRLRAGHRHRRGRGEQHLRHRQHLQQ